MSHGVDLEPVRSYVEQLRVIKDTKRALDEREKELRAAIENEMGDHEEGQLDGETVITWKSFKRTALNQKLLKDLYPKVWAECHDTTLVRSFRFAD